MKTSLACLVVVVGMLVGCGEPTGILRPVRIEPLPEYATWWQEVEACTGRSGNLAAIHWYTADNVTAEGQAGAVHGAWEPPHTIYFLRGWERDRMTVQHEMLHDLLQGDANHHNACFWTLGPGSQLSP